MSRWLLREAGSGRVVATEVRRADGWLTRTIGFLPRRSIGPSEGLWFERCRTIHTLGMRVALDVVFIDREGRVTRIEAGVRPGRWQVGDRRAATVAEFAAGFAAANGLVPGDRLVLEPAGALSG